MHAFVILTMCYAKLIEIVFIKVGETGRVVGIDHIPELVDMSIQNVKKQHADLLDSGRLKLIGMIK